MIELAATILKNFGLNDTQYEIRINDLQALQQTLSEAGLNDIEAHQYRKLLDKKDKMSDFDEQAERLLGRPFTLTLAPSEAIETVIAKLHQRRIANVRFVPSLVRGFDYYTGLVFEVFSTDPTNNRSLFGGGRYDNLTSLFDDTPMPAVGFGMGDVTTRDVLETYNLLPPYKPTTAVSLCVLNDAFYDLAAELAQELRLEGLNVSLDVSGKKIGEQITKANKRGVPFIIAIGDDEAASDTFVVKHMATGVEKKCKRRKIAAFVKKATTR
jgi:histidyl-tRNA synthetase